MSSAISCNSYEYRPTYLSVATGEYRPSIPPKCNVRLFKSQDFKRFADLWTIVNAYNYLSQKCNDPSGLYARNQKVISTIIDETYGVPQALNLIAEQIRWSAAYDLKLLQICLPVPCEQIPILQQDTNNLELFIPTYDKKKGFINFFKKYKFPCPIMKVKCKYPDGKIVLGIFLKYPHGKIQMIYQDKVLGKGWLMAQYDPLRESIGTLFFTDIHVLSLSDHVKFLWPKFLLESQALWNWHKFQEATKNALDSLRNFPKDLNNLVREYNSVEYAYRDCPSAYALQLAKQIFGDKIERSPEDCDVYETWETRTI